MKRLHLDVDQLLIFFLLAVTIRQMGQYLGSFSDGGYWQVFGYLQAVAVDLAIWRSAWWYRRYRGRKQRRFALLGILTFALVSGWYNFGYYTMQAPSLPVWHRALMAAVLPAGVALLSYLFGVKEESAFGHKEPKSKRQQTEPEPEPQFATKRDHIEHILRNEPDITQAELARQAGASASYVSERVAVWNRNGGGG